MTRLLEKLNFKRTTDGRYFKSKGNLILQKIEDRWQIYNRGYVVFVGPENKAIEYFKVNYIEK